VRFVLDTSAAVKCCAPEEGSDEAIGLLRKERRSELRPGTASHALRDFGLLDIELMPHAPMLAEATALASERGHGVCDCLFLMLARDRNLPVITFDGPMAGLARKLGISLWTPVR
jgi:predicted nucleic acid-binding protein